MIRYCTSSYEPWVEMWLVRVEEEEEEDEDKEGEEEDEEGGAA